MKKLHIKKDDVVVVISGDDKGTKGKVLAVSPEEGKVMVEGVNVVSKHQKARRQGDSSQTDLPLVQWFHTVEKVSAVSCSGVDGAQGLGLIGKTVPH